jgi:hypothetical protein
MTQIMPKIRSVRNPGPNIAKNTKSAHGNNRNGAKSSLFRPMLLTQYLTLSIIHIMALIPQ